MLFLLLSIQFKFYDILGRSGIAGASEDPTNNETTQENNVRQGPLGGIFANIFAGQSGRIICKKTTF